MTAPQHSPSPSPAASGLDRRLLAALVAGPLLLVLLAPSPAEACRYRARSHDPHAVPQVPEDPALGVGVEREADGVLTPTPSGPAPADERLAAPPDQLRLEPAPERARPECGPEPASPEVAGALTRADDDALPNGEAARMLALAAVLLLGVDLGAAAYRRRVRLAASIGLAVLLAVGSLIYLVALSPWPQWPLMVVPAAAATVIATRALVQSR
ncbi:MAG: hypothetical protein R3B09_31400 [Nannocystaceae bacterium]